jgi:NAD+ kinase
MSETPFVQSSRMPNKLASLHIDHKPSDWTPDIELQISPDDTRKANGGPSPAPLSRDYTAVPHGAKPTTPHHHLPPLSPSKLPVNSPCFVHSHLDKSAHLTDWLKNKHSAENHDVGVARSLQLPSAAALSPAAAGLANGNGYGYGAGLSDDEDEEFHGSLTKRLAETAVGVREMSKQLGVCNPLYAPRAPAFLITHNL